MTAVPASKTIHMKALNILNLLRFSIVFRSGQCDDSERLDCFVVVVDLLCEKLGYRSEIALTVCRFKK